eukprot:TRINITY_DN1449_c0_g1_i1.p1 TRINITY_DN1449_c0_g1~~TRINITY_DN1449_c0_g1_i1.p1  ORF type:complete len:336 (-),score=76.60 TRINITY_DN1449_c0_g1_i1:56-1063(-)
MEHPTMIAPIPGIPDQKMFNNQMNVEMPINLNLEEVANTPEEDFKTQSMNVPENVEPSSSPIPDTFDEKEIAETMELNETPEAVPSVPQSESDLDLHNRTIEEGEKVRNKMLTDQFIENYKILSRHEELILDQLVNTPYNDFAKRQELGNQLEHTLRGKIAAVQLNGKDLYNVDNARPPRLPGNYKRKREESAPQPAKRRKQRRSTSTSTRLIDITQLLVLPQKEAASRLGISESMLCKRYKECTRMKWPHRQLKKIDKQIRLMTMNRVLDQMPIEDRRRVDELHQERDHVLSPIIIRVSADCAPDFPDYQENVNEYPQAPSNGQMIDAAYKMEN